MKKKIFIIVTSILVIITLTCSIYVFGGTKNAEKLIWEYLETKGYTGSKLRILALNIRF